MSGIETLHNRGVLALNPPLTVAHKTLIVLGAARGGTSMVAGALSKLGVLMGERLSAVYEDVELSRAVEGGDLQRLDQLIAERNRLHACWGWKRPDSIRHAPVWRGRFRNPHYVAVFRDLFAIANRNRISMNSDVLDNMRHNQQHFGLILDFLAGETAPALLVSYEKAMAHPENFVQALREFAGQGDDAGAKAALDFIERDSETYLKMSRNTGGAGALDRVGATLISGWALYKQALARPVKVRIRINENREYIVAADRPRPDLKEKGLHPTGNRGFLLTLPEGEGLKRGDRVSARIVDDITDLNNSPRVYDGGR